MSSINLQALLRFLSQDAKVPLATAMGKVKDLQAAHLDSPDALAKIKPGDIKHIFADEKVAKQIVSAAKRTLKKRAAGDDGAPSPRKKRKGSFFSAEEIRSPAEQEETLLLPHSDLNEDELSEATLFTNRAPLVLAFVVTLLKHNMPEQPLSSRLSLAQAYVSITSRSRAVNLGIETGRSAEEEGLGEGQPVITVMGKDIRVLRRWGYDWKASNVEIEPTPQETLKAESPDDSALAGEVEADDNKAKIENSSAETPALWALDLEALKKSNNNHTTIPAQSGTHSSLPIFTPQSARAYLFKSFNAPPNAGGTPAKKMSAAAKANEKEQNLGRLLKALDMLYDSWAGVLTPVELDKRTWNWYVKVRPDVENGVAGWGGKNEVKLAEILALRRES